MKKSIDYDDIEEMIPKRYKIGEGITFPLIAIITLIGVMYISQEGAANFSFGILFLSNVAFIIFNFFFSGKIEDAIKVAGIGKGVERYLKEKERDHDSK